MKKYILDILKGMVLGIANIVPGISGGMLAMTMGIYERIINIIGNIFYSIFKDFKNTIKFMLPLGIGGVLGILLFSKIIKSSLELYHIQTIFLFIGLLLGTMPLFLKEANKNGFKKVYITPGIILLVLMIVLSNIIVSLSVVFEFDIDTMIRLFIYGIVIAGTMIIPGVSGSFILILLGAYIPILNLIDLKLVLSNPSQIFFLIPLGIGVIIGLVLFSKIVSIFLKKFYGYTYYTIVCFVVGSFILVLKDINWNLKSLLIGTIMLIIGTILSYTLEKKMNK